MTLSIPPARLLLIRMIATFPLAVLAPAGCELMAGDKGHPADAQGQMDAGVAGDTGDASGIGAGTLSFTPSNIPGRSFAGLGRVMLTGACRFDTDKGDIVCPSSADRVVGYSFAQVEQPDGSKAGVFVLSSLTVGSASQVRVVGSIPGIIVAAETIDIDGSLSAVASYDELSAGGFTQDPTGRGAGPGGGDPAHSYTGGGGAGYCGRGGKGGIGQTGGLPSNGGMTYGTPMLVPLIGGSAGGGGAAASLSESGGQGGGALQLTAGQHVRVSTAGQINVGGLPGRSNGGGAGSGGALLIEAPTVIVSGILSANGGGGALFNGGSSGQPGQPAVSRALGSAATAGQGNSSTEIDGTDGTATAGSANSAGGGGGGAGRIRINTASGAATITTATISPSPTTPCTTQGTLTPRP